MNKIFLLGLLLFLTFVSYSQDTQETIIVESHAKTKELNWIPSFEKASQIAKKKNKPLLVFFTGSDWCGPCKMLHADFFESEELIALAKKELVLYEADFPRRTDLISPEKKQENYKLKNTYGIRGYPTMILLNSDGLEIGRRTGYSRSGSTEYHFNEVRKAIKNNK